MSDFDIFGYNLDTLPRVKLTKDKGNGDVDILIGMDSSGTRYRVADGGDSYIDHSEVDALDKADLISYRDAVVVPFDRNEITPFTTVTDADLVDAFKRGIQAYQALLARTPKDPTAALRRVFSGEQDASNPVSYESAIALVRETLAKGGRLMAPESDWTDEGYDPDTGLRLDHLAREVVEFPDDGRVFVVRTICACGIESSPFTSGGHMEQTREVATERAWSTHKSHYEHATKEPYPSGLIRDVMNEETS